MSSVEVIVTKIIDTGQPYWVECKMLDVYGEEHIFHAKMPIFLQYDVTESELPVNGEFRCKIIKSQGDIIKIDTSEPYDIESQSGKTVFDVSINQIKL